MAEFIEPAKLQTELDDLMKYTDIERDLDNRFREAYSPFENTIHRPVSLEAIDFSPISSTSYMLKAHLPTAAPEREDGDTSSRADTILGSNDEDMSLKEAMLKEVTTIGKKEHISTWQGNLVHNKKASAGILTVDDHGCLNDSDHGILLSEKATSTSISEDGECIRPNGDVQTNDDDDLDNSSTCATGYLTDSDKPYLFKRDRKQLAGSPDGFVTKRRRSARLAKLFSEAK
ncbi:hypothetical protein BDV25DRAFT_75880 [Aspergillus avenaceus]|uniref:Uncharacterized protein n=1 Tax=Aspergillus avenaceus TaxID=36643 RepID=A0A5N6TGA9_ASPAV|nr:hypothetical protein BDV25DRAFT_75880 [Aspergillus avenaceus]